MKIAYFDCFSGAAGDMIVGALIDAGAPRDELLARLRALGVSGYELAAEKVCKQGLSATRFDVTLTDQGNQPHRHLEDVYAILNEASLGDSVRAKAKAIFRRLAEAEASVHGTTVDKIHFHEVGAVDAIVDVVGAASALELLGVDRVVCSEFRVGSGTVRCAHGVLPVPAPATVELIKGIAFRGGDEEGELLTPTGAAVLTTLADSFGPVPAMRVTSIGYGAGSRDGAHGPNVLRVLIGESDEDAESDRVTVLETNIDDATPEMVGHCIERLLAEGALDAYVVPITMKKGRPGMLLAVIAPSEKVEALERIVFAESTTLGIRRHEVLRTKLRRVIETVETPYGSIRMKIGSGAGVVTAGPEYEDCRKAALKHKVALRTVMEAARAAWQSVAPVSNR